MAKNISSKEMEVEQKTLLEEEQPAPEEQEPIEYEEEEYEGDVVDENLLTEESSKVVKADTKLLTYEQELEQNFKEMKLAQKAAAREFLKDPSLWTKWGSNYRPNHTAVTRCCKTVGISYKTELESEVVQKDYVSYTHKCYMEFTRKLVQAAIILGYKGELKQLLKDIGVEALGTWDTFKDQFKNETGDFRRFAGNIRKSSHSQAEVNAFMVLMGMKYPSEAELAEFGIDASKIKAVPFKKKF